VAFGIDDAISAGLEIINKFIPDPAQKQAAEDALRTSLQQWDAQQNAVNAVEGGNNAVFVSGWRPAIGWVCACALAFQYLVRPLLLSLSSVMHWQSFNLPGLDDNLWQLMMGMLGMGGLRTFEKIKGVTK
jgi:hypothetical protein